jgi:pantoate ligase/cytidylate kinase
MQLFKTIAGLQAALETQNPENTLGLVPTMGALHPGHVSLIKRAIAENDQVVVSIFINPLQFAPTEDLNQYPRNLEKDLDLCEKLGVNLIFAPSVAQLYGSQNTAQNSASLSQNTQVIPPNFLTSGLCGQFRPGHFQGVATVVTKLLNIIRPNRAYFGEKDAQQLAIIRYLVRDLHIPVNIVGCPIIREKSGLAYSSRNQYLTPEQREKAAIIYQSLDTTKEAFCQGETLTGNLLAIFQQKISNIPEIKLEYAELVHPETLQPIETLEEAGLLAVAAYIGSTRLIDNIALRHRQPIIAIDGPAGAGKSTVTRRIAQKLGLLYLDTGAMYRAVTWLVMELGVSVDDRMAIAELVSQAEIELIPGDPITVKINHQDVTQAIRTPEVTANVSKISAQNAVRQRLVKIQQSWGKKGGLVAEGRDIGSNVFPDAELKIFLTASVQERARRRLQDLEKQGRFEISLAQLEQEIEARDYQDSHRKIAPLIQCEDAMKLVTDNLTIEEVTDKIIHWYQEKLAN